MATKCRQITNEISRNTGFVARLTWFFCIVHVRIVETLYAHLEYTGFSALAFFVVYVFCYESSVVVALFGNLLVQGPLAYFVATVEYSLIKIRIMMTDKIKRAKHA